MENQDGHLSFESFLPGVKKSYNFYPEVEKVSQQGGFFISKRAAGDKVSSQTNLFTNTFVFRQINFYGLLQVTEKRINNILFPFFPILNTDENILSSGERRTSELPILTGMKMGKNH